MDIDKIIDKYYSDNSELKDLLVLHSESVARKAFEIVDRDSSIGDFNLKFIREASMLHDIGVFLTNAPFIYCYGTSPYICHGVLGAEILRKEGLPYHALVCERHTGAGISLQQIIDKDLPLPHRDMLPVSKEEVLICYADMFFSKTDPYREKSIHEVEKSLQKHGQEGIIRFRKWHKMFS
ncbi:MAG TPA: HDIG domain-containing protein [Bacteroidaceae bacterium]|nr:HDIG domain-containing protein [Bacteroidaceae bacterium]